jgi:arylsulfatase A-like enzyme
MSTPSTTADAAPGRGLASLLAWSVAGAAAAALVADTVTLALARVPDLGARPAHWAALGAGSLALGGCAGLAGAILYGIALGCKRARAPAPRIRDLGAALLAASPAGLLVWSIDRAAAASRFGGAWWMLPARLVAAVAGVLAAILAARAALRLANRRAGHGRAAAVAALAAALALVLAIAALQQRFLGRGYPEVRLAAAAAVVWIGGLAGMAGGALVGPRRGATRRLALAAAACGAVLVAAAALEPAARILRALALPPTLVGAPAARLALARAHRPAAPATTAARRLAELGRPQPVDAAVLDERWPERRRFNLVWITIDTLRADHVGHLGYARRTTPQLDRLAAESTTFTAAWAQYPSSLLSMASMFASRLPVATDVFQRVEGKDSLPPGPVDDLFAAQMLGERGWSTAATSAMAKDLMRKLFSYLPQGFAAFESSPNDEFLSGDRVTDGAVAQLPGADGAPHFRWVHYFDAHAPYVTRKEHDFGPRALDRYDSEIAFADAQMGRLLDALRARDDWQRTIVVVHADHGEEFGEHGGQHHGSSLFEEQIRVPLVIRVPGAAPRRCDTAAGLVDILPTVLEIQGIDAGDDLHGKSLVREILGLERDRPAAPVFAQIRESGAIGVRLDCVREGRWKLLADRITGSRRLYDLERDPAERSDTAASDPERVAALEEWLDAFEAQTTRGAHGRSSTVPQLVARLAETSEHERASLINKIAYRGGLRTLGAEHWRSLLSDPDEVVRATAVGHLRRERCAAAFDALARTLADESLEVRRNAARALGIHGDRRAISLLEPASDELLTARAAHLSRALLGDARVATYVEERFAAFEGYDRLLAIGAAATLDLGGAQRLLRSSLERQLVPEPYGSPLLEIAARPRDPSIALELFTRAALDPMSPQSWSSLLDGIAAFPARDMAPLLRLGSTSPAPAVRERVRAIFVAAGVDWEASLLEVDERAAAALDAARGACRPALAAEKLHEACIWADAHGIADWGLALFEWAHYAQAADWPHAAQAAHAWSGRVAWPSFARAAMVRLRTIAEGAGGEPELSLAWIFQDQRICPGEPWTAGVAVRALRGALPGGLSFDPPWLTVKLKDPATGSVLLEDSRRFPLLGALPGEEIPVLILPRLQILAAGDYAVEVELVWRGLPRAAPLLGLVNVKN